ncbi:MAG: hypothetical protein ACLQRH_04480 [Acidimicrobiales bacterium]
MTNDFQFLASVVVELLDADYDVDVFGGWAEELLGLTVPRPPVTSTF